MGAEAEKAGMPWTVYVLVSKSSSRSYVGITKDLDRRLQQHNGELPGGARSTTHGRPWRIGVRYGPFEERGEAQRVEYEVKKRRGADRLVWVPAAPGI